LGKTRKVQHGIISLIIVRTIGMKKDRGGDVVIEAKVGAGVGAGVEIGVAAENGLVAVFILAPSEFGFAARVHPPKGGSVIFHIIMEMKIGRVVVGIGINIVPPMIILGGGRDTMPRTVEVKTGVVKETLVPKVEG
jgi:hypothetical protein